jgi:hypothetical protein
MKVNYRGTIPLKRIHRIKKEKSMLCDTRIFHKPALLKKYIAKQWIPGKMHYPSGGYRRLVVIPITGPTTGIIMFGFCKHKGWCIKHDCWETNDGFYIPDPDLPQDAKAYLRYGRVSK